MKILVLGSTGMAGHLITIYLKEKGHDVTAYSMKPFPYCKNIIGNAFDTHRLKSILIDGEYQIVINCIGILGQVSEENPSKAVYLNSYLPHFIADTIKDSRTRLIHMSTDCVFAGNSGPYFEDSLRDGRSLYDRSKALGEIEDNKNLTFRNSIIGPDINVDGIGLFNWFMKQTGPIYGYSGAIWTGVTTLTLAKAIEQSILDNLTGIYNLVNNESISKYSLLQLFNKYFKNNLISITESDVLQIDKSLRSKRTDFNFIVPTYDQMVCELTDWVNTHKYLYPNYIN